MWVKCELRSLIKPITDNVVMIIVQLTGSPRIWQVSNTCVIKLLIMINTRCQNIVLCGEKSKCHYCVTLLVCLSDKYKLHIHQMLFRTNKFFSGFFVLWNVLLQPIGCLQLEFALSPYFYNTISTSLESRATSDIRSDNEKIWGYIDFITDTQAHHMLCSVIFYIQWGPHEA